MEMMKSLYEKVAADGVLQEKFNTIMREAEEAGEAVTGEKLVAFSQEAGFNVGLEEMKSFFKEISEKSSGELSDMELDMVAGGKSLTGILNIAASAGSFGIACAVGSAQHAVANAIDSSATSCQDCFK